MGRKHIVPYGLFQAHGYVSAPLVYDDRKGIGFTEEDLQLLSPRSVRCSSMTARPPAAKWRSASWRSSAMPQRSARRALRIWSGE